MTLSVSALAFLSGPTVRRADEIGGAGSHQVLRRLLALGLVERIGDYLRITAKGLGL